MQNHVSNCGPVLCKQTNTAAVFAGFFAFFSVLFTQQHHNKDFLSFIRHRRGKEIVKIYLNMQMLYMLDVNARVGTWISCTDENVGRKQKITEKKKKRNFMTACNVNIVFLYVRPFYWAHLCYHYFFTYSFTFFVFHFVLFPEVCVSACEREG